MRVVFVHPSHPSQFTRIAEGLAASAGWVCACLVRDEFADSVRRDNPPIAYYGYREAPAPMSGNHHLQCFEEGVRCGKAALEALAHIRASEGLDVVVGHASFGTTFFARQLLGLPVVTYVELPGYFPIFARREFPAQYPQALMDVSLRALIHASVLQSDVCVVPSNHAKRLFPRELQSKVKVQTEGFVLPDLTADRRAVRRRMQIGDTAPVIGFAGRTLEAVRGFDVFCRVATAILAARPDARFLVIGNEETIYGNETPYLGGRSFKQHALEAYVPDARAFRFESFLPHGDFLTCLQAMDLILFPLFEGAANWALFDAMAAGVPVLASNCCFIPEVITHGQDGLLFAPDDIGRFARTAIALIDQPERRADLGRRARAKIARRFSVDKAVHGYRAIIEEAVARTKRRSFPARQPPGLQGVRGA